jgi:hypothetical protein
MARVDLRCGGCGYAFFVSDVQLQKSGGVKCPSCLRPVGLEGPSEAPLSRPAVRVLEGAKENRRMPLILGAAAVLLVVVAGVLLIVKVRPGGGEEYDPEESSGRRPPAPAAPPAPAPPRPRPAPAPVPPAPRPVAAPPSAAVPAPAAVPTPVTPPPPEPAAASLPPELAAQAKDILAMDPYYLGLMLTPTERVQVERAASGGAGEAVDVDLVRRIADGPKLKAIRDEVAQLDDAIRKLETEALENLPLDKVVMNDKREFFGRIVEETPERVRLEQKRAGGLSGVLPLARADVKEVLKGKGPGGEFRTRWAPAKESASGADLAALLAWCKERSMPLQASLVATVLARREPSRADARSEAGLPVDPVARAVEADKQGGFIPFQGRNWVPRELKEKLLKDGYRIVNGQWNARKERMITMPGLFRYEDQTDKPVLLSGTGTGIAHDIERTYQSVLDANRGAWIEKVQVKHHRRYWTVPLSVREVQSAAAGLAGDLRDPNIDYQGLKDFPEPPAGRPVAGEVFITVPINEPVVEAWVTTKAEVKAGGSITVNLLHNGAKHKVYVCAAKEDSPHRLPDLVIGKTQIDLVADISFVATYRPKTDRRTVKPARKVDNRIVEKGIVVVHSQQIPDPSAVLFPSNSNTIETFRLKVLVGEPAPGIDKLFENAREILRD